jgi:hypothetical protein
MTFTVIDKQQNGVKKSHRAFGEIAIAQPK